MSVLRAPRQNPVPQALGVTHYPTELEPEAEAAAVTAAPPVAEIRLNDEGTINGGRFTIVSPVEATMGKLTAFHPAPTVAQVEQNIRIEAAEQGADAVINMRIEDVRVCALSWGCRQASGTAVKYTR